MTDIFEVPSLDDLNPSSSDYVSQLDQGLLNMDSKYHWIDGKAEVIFDGLVARLKEGRIDQAGYNVIKATQFCSDMPGLSRECFDIEIGTKSRGQTKKIERIIESHIQETAPQYLDLLGQEKKLDQDYAAFRLAAAETSDVNALNPINLKYDSFVIYLQGKEDILEIHFDIRDLKKSEPVLIGLVSTYEYLGPELSKENFLGELREATRELPCNVYVVTNSIERVQDNQVINYALGQILEEVSELEEQQSLPVAEQMAKDLEESLSIIWSKNTLKDQRSRNRGRKIREMFARNPHPFNKK